MTTNLLLLAAFVFSMILMSYGFVKRKKKVIFFGDSITEQGERRGGYIARIKELIRNADAEEKFELISSGVSGNTVLDLYQRLEKDVMAKGPSIVVVFIGVNDIWQKLLGAVIDSKEFERIYVQIVTRMKEAGIKLILVTPAVIGEKQDMQNELDSELDEYASIIKSIAFSFALPVVDIRTAFISHNTSNNLYNQDAGILTTDGVHLSDKGNEIVANQIWRVLREVK